MKVRRLGLLTFHGGVALFWVASVGSLLAREVWHPWLNSQGPPTVLKPPVLGPEGRESWMGIYAEKTKIGYLHQKEGADPSGGSVMWQEGRVVLSMLGERRDLSFNSDIRTDAQGQIDRFSTVLQFAPTRILVEGTRTGKTLTLKIQQGQASWTSNVPLTQPAILPSHIPGLIASGQLKPGQSLQITLIDPFTFQPGQVEILFNGRRSFVFGGKRNLANQIELRYQGLVTTSWIADDGTVLMEESPWGWMLRREDQAKAVHIDLAEWSHPPDFLSMVAVPTEVWIRQPREVTFLELTLARPDRPTPEHLTLRVAQPPAVPWKRPILDPAFAPELAATPFIQVNDPAIQRKAAAIVGTEMDSWQAARRINDWVYRSVRKVPTLGLPVSTEVLRKPAGDCNEHTCLFVALARSSGIPCRIVMGLVYFEGSFVYHTWPRVFVGSWVDLDPTLGQAPADATHVPLMEADLEESVRMASLVGKLQIVVESYR